MKWARKGEMEIHTFGPTTKFFIPSMTYLCPVMTSCENMVLMELEKLPSCCARGLAAILVYALKKQHIVPLKLPKRYTLERLN